MAEGIRATVEFPPPPVCPVADVSSRTDTTVDRVWASVSGADARPSVTEFFVQDPEPPEVPGAERILSLSDRHLFRLAHDADDTCPCECLGAAGCAVHRYVARSGRLRLVFNAAGYEELQAVVGSLRSTFPDLDVRRLVRSPAVEETADGVFVDRGKLTDRQREVLGTAYRMGYFDRPRGANGTEVAAALDISPSTFAEHLATAQSKLLADVLEDGP